MKTNEPRDREEQSPSDQTQGGARKDTDSRKSSPSKNMDDDDTGKKQSSSGRGNDNTGKGKSSGNSGNKSGNRRG